MVEAEPIGALYRDLVDLTVTTGDRLVVNHLLEHDFLSPVQLEFFWMILRGCLSERSQPFSMRTPALWAGPKIKGPAAQCTATMGAATTTSTTPTSSTICRSSKGSQIVCFGVRRRVSWGGGGWSCTFLAMAEISCYDHTPQHLHSDAPLYTVPEGTLIVYCLIVLTHNHEAEDGSHFLFVPFNGLGFPDFWVERAAPFKRGAAFFFNALDVHRGSGIPKAAPTGVSDPRLMAFFAIKLTQGPVLRFSNLHVTQAIKRPRLGKSGGRGAKTALCEGAVRCRGKVVAKCYGCEQAGLCTAHKDGLFVPCQEGEDPKGVSIEQCVQCLLPPGTTTAHFLLTGCGGGGGCPPHH